MTINYNGKKFKPKSVSDNGLVTDQIIFNYKQEGNILTCTYEGGQIKKGHLIGIVNKEGKIDMRYHQINVQSQLMTGICTSTPELLSNGKIMLHEKWQWTSGDQSEGSSILEEL